MSDSSARHAAIDALDAAPLQRTIDEALDALERRAAALVSTEELTRIESLLCSKIDRGLTLTVREQDILDHIEEIGVSGHATGLARLLLPALALLTVAAIAAWLLAT